VTEAASNPASTAGVVHTAAVSATASNSRS
jgi:hypothetical protein